MPPAVNYTPLEKMHHSGTTVFKKSFGGHGVLVFIGVIALFILVLISPIHQFSVAVLIIYGAVLAAKVNAYKNKVWQDFAAANGWTVTKAALVANLLPPSVNYGHSPNYSPVIQAKLGNINSELFTYDTTTGQGKYQTVHFFTIARVGLPKALPHIILDSKKNNADINARFSDHEPLQLEGDFPKYFSLIMEKGQEVDVLAILTPDIMQVLVDTNSNEDIEIDGANMYFIIRDDKRNPEAIKSLIDSASVLTGEIEENIRLAAPLLPAKQ